MRRWATLAVAAVAVAGCGYKLGGPPNSPAGRGATGASIGKPGDEVPKLPPAVQKQLDKVRR
jgi:hypothetical protein